MSRDIKAKMGIPARFGSFGKLIPEVLDLVVLENSFPEYYLRFLHMMEYH
jgi:hypothetical protein